MAGVVSELSDVSINGCAECPLSEATLRLWRTDTAVTTVEAASDLASTNPTFTVEASERYRAALEPSNYLVCAGSTCVNVAVIEGVTATVHVRLRFGPTSFVVADRASGELVEDYGLDIGFQ